MVSVIRKVFLLSCFLLLATVVNAQNKFEKESRVNEQEVPLNALVWIKKYNFPNIKWYREISERGTSYEAKFKFDGFKYSAEFDSLGLIEDVEITCSTNQLGDSISAVIYASLRGEFGNQFKIKKLQLQVIPHEGMFDSLFFSDLLKSDHQYEVVFFNKSKSQKGLYQAVITKNGIIKSLQKIVPPNLDVLEF